MLYIENLSPQKEAQKMLPDLERLYQSIERRKAEMLAHLDTLTDRERNTNPTAAEWSPLQVMEHLVIVEEWMAGPNAAPLPANAKVLLKGRMFMTFAIGILRRGVRVPTLPTAVPGGDLDFMAIKRRWSETRERLLSKLGAVTRETQPLPVALHPVAGPLNAAQVLDILDVHLAYHWRHFPHDKSL